MAVPVITRRDFLARLAAVGVAANTLDGGAIEAAFQEPPTWYFKPGTFVRLDGGTLDLGPVRDSTLRATNDYQVFAETFKEVMPSGTRNHDHAVGPRRRGRPQTTAPRS